MQDATALRGWPEGDAQVETPPVDAKGQGPSILSTAVAALFLILLASAGALVVLSFPAGIYTVFYTHISSSTAASQGYPFLWIGPVAVLVPVEVTYGGAFLTVLVIYAAMFVVAVLQGRSLPAAVASGLRRGYGELLSNRALLTLVAIAFLVFTAGLVDTISSAFAPIGNPFSGGDDLLTFIGLTLAPLREEFGFRVMLIGLAALAVTLPRPGVPSAGKVKSSLRTLWRPSSAYEGIDNNTLTLVIIWVAGAFSSATFGACHVVCGGGGWEIGKLPEAVYGGAVLSVLYIKYGFHVAVLAHWGIDYLVSVFAFFGEGVAGISWQSGNPYFLQAFTERYFFGIFGIACLLAIAYLGFVRLREGRREQSKDTLEVHMPQTTGDDVIA